MELQISVCYRSVVLSFISVQLFVLSIFSSIQILIGMNIHMRIFDSVEKRNCISV